MALVFSSKAVQETSTTREGSENGTPLTSSSTETLWVLGDIHA